MKNVEEGTNMIAVERQQEKMKRWDGDNGVREKERKSLHQSEKMKVYEESTLKSYCWLNIVHLQSEK